MKRIFLKISDARLECQDEHPSLLAALENHLADEHKEMARDYALEALRREPTS